MGSLGMGEILIIFLVLLLLFGAKRLPELAKGLGKSIREFKKATNEITDEFDINKTINSPKPPKPEINTPKKEENSGDTTNQGK